MLGALYLLGRMIANTIGVISIDLERALGLRATQTAALAAAAVAAVVAAGPRGGGAATPADLRRGGGALESAGTERGDRVSRRERGRNQRDFGFLGRPLALQCLGFEAIRAKHGHAGDGAELGRRRPALGDWFSRFFAWPRRRSWPRPPSQRSVSQALAPLPLPRQWLALWSVVLGLSTGSYPTVLTLVKASMPKGVIVHAVALVSMGSMIGVFVGQWRQASSSTPFPARRRGRHPVEAYSTLFGVFAAVMAVSASMFWRVQRRSR